MIQQALAATGHSAPKTGKRADEEESQGFLPQRSEEEKERLEALRAEAASMSTTSRSGSRGLAPVLNSIGTRKRSADELASSSTSMSAVQAKPKVNPEEWQMAIDPNTQRPYYYNVLTRATQWAKPEGFVETGTSHSDRLRIQEYHKMAQRRFVQISSLAYAFHSSLMIVCALA